jgi:hypothetical protein
MRWPAFALVLAGTAAMAAVVPSPPDEDEYEPSRKAWVEQAVNLPAYPKPASLLEFPVSAASNNRFLIDADTLSLGKDGVVRYTLVVRSAGGAENVSFEGMRCATREQKFYAFGQRGAWVQVRDSQWRPIQSKDMNRQHAALYADYLCADIATFQRPLREILQRLRYGRP